MKTIEQKARRYDEAIERMKDFLKEWEDCGAVGEAMEKARNVFPELKESEDEMIRKVLLDFLKNELKKHGDEEWDGCFHTTDMIAWLEKQGEQKPIEPTDLKTWKYIVDAVLTEREGIGQYIDSPWTTDVAEKLQKRFGNIEQNPVNTSISFDTVTGVLRFNNLTLEQAEAMRKALFGKQKPAWSEEDERLRSSCISHIEEELERIRNDKYGHSEIISDLKESCRERINWLKSLIPQTTWKPSDAQMVALDGICSYIRNKADWEISQDMVSDLYKLSEQLKKLKGE